MKRKKRELAGQIFNRLTVLRKIEKRSCSQSWECLCSCGTIKVMTEINIISGRSKSCGCLVRETMRVTGKQTNYHLINPEASFVSLFSRYKTTAKSRNIPFKLTEPEFRTLTSSNCSYCGIIPSNKIVKHKRPESKISHKPYFFNGIDRIKPELGYSQENCVPCCKTCNYARNTLSVEDFKNWIDRLIEFQLKIKEKND